MIRFSAYLPELLPDFLTWYVKKIARLPNFTTILLQPWESRPAQPRQFYESDDVSLNMSWDMSHEEVLQYIQNACLLFFFHTKYCRLQKFIQCIRAPSSFSVVIHTSYRRHFVDAHIFCGMHDALTHYWVHRRKQEAFKGGALWIVHDVMDWW